MTKRKDVAVKESASGKRWVLNQTDNELVTSLSRKFDIPLVLAEVLANRDIDLDLADDYLDPKIKNLMPNPSVMKDMDKAVKRIADAIEADEKVAVFGDFDVDGATSSALLKNYFRAINQDIEIYIPHRVKEGYGPQIDAFKQLKVEKDVSLIITVDCGASAHSVIKEANDLDLTTIVFDHHQAKGELPPAHAVVNPNHESDPCELSYLAGCGVTFMSLVALQRELKKRGYFEKKGITPPDLTKSLDLVALGTVCDVMPIVGLNRAFVKQGLKIMDQRENLGLKFLLNVAEYDGKGKKGKPRDESDVLYPAVESLISKTKEDDERHTDRKSISVYALGFVLGPRINAGGRLGDVPDLGARLLSSTDEQELAEIALELNRLNILRRGEQEDALKQIFKDGQEQTDDMFVMLQNENWHPGIIGIMAGRIKEEVYKPTAVLTKDDKTGLWKGSARSVEQVDLGSIILDAKKQGILEAGGGHKMAAGFSLKEENLDKFRSFMNEEIEKQLKGQELKEDLKVTSVISFHAATKNLAEQLKLLEPCGQGNPKPKFLISGVTVKDVRLYDKGESDFMILTLGDAGGKGYTKAIVMAKKGSGLHTLLLDANASGRVVNLLGSLEINVYDYEESVPDPSNRNRVMKVKRRRETLQINLDDAVLDSADLSFKKKMKNKQRNRAKKKSPFKPR